MPETSEEPPRREPQTSQRFLPCEHLRKGADFEAVYQHRKSVSNQVLIVYGRANQLPHNRLGLSVSRKHGSAVVRNRIRRWFREIYRLTKSTLPTGIDLVLIPRGGQSLRWPELQEGFPHLVRQLARKLGLEKTHPQPDIKDASS